MRESISWYVAGSARRFSVIAVTIGPGCTEFARMPSFAYWMAVTLVSRRTAPLEAGYIGLVMSVPTSPSWDEMLTIEPPPARRMAGMAALLPRNTPVAFTSITRCHASSDVSSTRAAAGPACYRTAETVRRKDTAMANEATASRVYVGVGSFTSGKRPGIFRRVGDGGWEQLNKGLPEATKVQAITVDPTNLDIIYI